MSLRIVFAGTPEFAVPSLRVACEACEVIAVYTQPDRPAGRGRALALSPVKQEALAQGIEVRQPETLRDADVQAALRALQPDLIVTAAYGLIFPKKVLAIPRLGCWNVHASLLPRWRGAAPIQRAIEAGDAEAGVCIMRMEAGLDTGPVYRCGALTVGDEMTAGELHDHLATLGADLLSTCLHEATAGTLGEPTPQPMEGITHAAKLEKSEARLDWSLPAAVLARKVRAFHPWPIAEAELAGERVRIHAAEVLDEATSSGDRGHHGTPGSVVTASKQGIDVATGAGVLRLLTLQREGGRPISAADYLNARRGAF